MEPLSKDKKRESGLKPTFTSSPLTAVLGIDPGSVVAGWSLVIKGGRVETGLMTAPKKCDFETRRDYLRNDFADLISEFQTRGDLGMIDVVAIEDPPSPGAKSIKALRTVGAMFEEISFGHGLAYIGVPTTSWHGLVRTLSGVRARPSDMKALSLGLAGQILKGKLTTDEADAYWIARYVMENAERLVE